MQRGRYNLVQHNLAVGEVVKAIREFYPELEMIFIDQHMKMRELQVKPSMELTPILKEVDQNLHAELKSFKESFTF